MDPNTERYIPHVDDDPDHALLTKLAFEQAGLTNPVQWLTDGQEALNYLAGIGRFVDRAKHPLPALLLLDLNIPKVPGIDVLRWIQCQPDLKPIPVVVLSVSDHPADVNTALTRGARSYFVKPASLSERLQLAKTISHLLGEYETAANSQFAGHFDIPLGRFRPEPLRYPSPESRQGPRPYVPPPAF